MPPKRGLPTDEGESGVDSKKSRKMQKGEKRPRGREKKGKGASRNPEEEEEELDKKRRTDETRKTACDALAEEERGLGSSLINRDAADLRITAYLLDIYFQQPLEALLGFRNEQEGDISSEEGISEEWDINIASSSAIRKKLNAILNYLRSDTFGENPPNLSDYPPGFPEEEKKTLQERIAPKLVFLDKQKDEGTGGADEEKISFLYSLLELACKEGMANVARLVLVLGAEMEGFDPVFYNLGVLIRLPFENQRGPSYHDAYHSISRSLMETWVPPVWALSPKMDFRTLGVSYACLERAIASCNIQQIMYLMEQPVEKTYIAPLDPTVNHSRLLLLVGEAGETRMQAHALLLHEQWERLSDPARLEREEKEAKKIESRIRTIEQRLTENRRALESRAGIFTSSVASKDTTSTSTSTSTSSSSLEYAKQLREYQKMQASVVEDEKELEKLQREWTQTRNSSVEERENIRNCTESLVQRRRIQSAQFNRVLRYLLLEWKPKPPNPFQLNSGLGNPNVREKFILLLSNRGNKDTLQWFSDIPSNDRQILGPDGKLYLALAMLASGCIELLDSGYLETLLRETYDAVFKSTNLQLGIQLLGIIAKLVGKFILVAFSNHFPVAASRLSEINLRQLRDADARIPNSKLFTDSIKTCAIVMQDTHDFYASVHDGSWNDASKRVETSDSKRVRTSNFLKTRSKGNFIGSLYNQDSILHANCLSAIAPIALLSHSQQQIFSPDVMTQEQYAILLLRRSAAVLEYALNATTEKSFFFSVYFRDDITAALLRSRRFLEVSRVISRHRALSESFIYTTFSTVDNFILFNNGEVAMPETCMTLARFYDGGSDWSADILSTLRSERVATFGGKYVLTDLLRYALAEGNLHLLAEMIASGMILPLLSGMKRPLYPLTMVYFTMGELNFPSLNTRKDDSVTEDGRFVGSDSLFSFLLFTGRLDMFNLARKPLPYREQRTALEWKTLLQKAKTPIKENWFNFLNFLRKNIPHAGPRGVVSAVQLLRENFPRETAGWSASKLLHVLLSSGSDENISIQLFVQPSASSRLFLYKRSPTEIESERTVELYGLNLFHKINHSVSTLNPLNGTVGGKEDTTETTVQYLLFLLRELSEKWNAGSKNVYTDKILTPFRKALSLSKQHYLAPFMQFFSPSPFPEFAQQREMLDVMKATILSVVTSTSSKFETSPLIFAFSQPNPSLLLGSELVEALMRPALFAIYQTNLYAARFVLSLLDALLLNKYISDESVHMQTYIQTRRAQLEKYLRDYVAHPLEY
jgi:hypothetical protein